MTNLPCRDKSLWFVCTRVGGVTGRKQYFLFPSQVRQLAFVDELRAGSMAACEFIWALSPVSVKRGESLFASGKGPKMYTKNHVGKGQRGRT